MASSSLHATDKRWAAPTRKSGMTVLGKIPKPINLPSQRLENHGLNPNVEIVPKGTHTWGTKPGPTTPNAWSTTSFLSPKKDGNSSAPSQFNGRPSSGGGSGGGSRPSTAGSESLDSPNAWGPNSRPSSASGTLPSSHLPVVTNRPRSADTRPGSSQLSRFADNSSEYMNVSIRTIDKSGSSSHGHGFTLSTGDFPTLGSEKSSESNNQRGHSSKGRPTSSSGKDGSQNGLGKSPTAGSGQSLLSANNQPADIMKTEQHEHDGAAPFVATGPPNEAQQPQSYPPNYGMPPPQFDSWRAPPGHPPEGMWHRGPAPGGPYRPVGPSSSFPVEPFTYYGQFPPNSEAAARQGSGHSGYHPKSGDAAQSVPPNSYILNRPVIPLRPVYQGPMPYDGCFVPQRANFNNSNVRDSPFIGGPHQPGILNQFPNQNDKFQTGVSQSRPVKHEAVHKELSESARVHLVSRGQPMVLHDNPDRSGGPKETEKKTQPAPPLLPHPDGNRSDVNMRTDTRDAYSERNMLLMKSVADQRGPARLNHSSALENSHSLHKETDDGTPLKNFKGDNVTLDQQPIIKKNAALIEKIGSLNNKARNVDVRYGADPSSSKGTNKKQQKGTDSKADQMIINVSTSATTGFSSASGEAARVSPISPLTQKVPNMPSDGAVVGLLHPHLNEFSKAGKLGGSTHDRPHKIGDSSRNNHRGPAKEMPAKISAGHGRAENSRAESLPVVQLSSSQHDQPLAHASQLPPVTITDDMPASPDYEFQREKMRELAVQRAKQLQAEEEERTKRQRAKALAKLEELNRRSSVHQKNSNDPLTVNDDVHNKQKAGLDATTEPASSTTESREVTASDNLSTLQPPHVQEDEPIQSMSTLPHAAVTAGDPVGQNTSMSGRNIQSNKMEHILQKSISRSHDVGVPRRHAVSEEKIPGEKSSIAVSTENAKKTVEASLTTPTAVVTSHDNPPATNKKSARNSRSKKRVDDAPATSICPPVVLNEQNTVSVSTEPKTQTAGVIISSSIIPTEGIMLTVGSITVGGISFGSFNQEHVKSPEEAHNTVKSRPRPQQAKRSGKNQHAVRPVEKPHGNEGVAWAPVKPPGKNEQSEEPMMNAAVAARPQPIGNAAIAGRPQPIVKYTNDGEIVTRTKRAEMERYVPKPLSKELQQQSSEKSCLENKSNDKAVEKSPGAKVDAAIESKKWEDKKTSRGHGKSHSSWRRRNTDESALVVPQPAEQADNCQGSHEVQKPSGQHQQLEADKQADYAVGNSLTPTETLALPASAAKEHTAANRQRRQHVKAAKTEGTNYINGNKDREGRKDVNSEHRNMSRSEVKSSGAVTHSRAHWKPKSSNPQTNPQGNGAMDGQVDSVTLQDSSNRNLAPNSSRNDEKDAPSNQGKGDMTHGDDNQKSESHENAEQQQLNHATRRQGHHNGRYHKGSGSGMHRERGYDAGKPSQVANAEKRRGGTHLEYQPVGSSSKPTDFQQNPSVDDRSVGPPAPGPLYRERGQYRGTRHAGHFVKRNPASGPATNSYQVE